MKTFTNQCAQGDILITRVDEIPSGVTPMSTENNHYVVAHSETGHHHVIDPADATAYEAANDPFIMYLAVDNTTELRHLRGFDTHESIQLRPGTYRINRQREYTPKGFRRAAD